LTVLQEFRNRLYSLLGNGKAALFDTPEQMETWSDLMPALTWQLWLARDAVEDAPLLWQKN
jgi:hypothetical protein